jgi:multisubunit Na+/H+ antiporter MnhE subunit
MKAVYIFLLVINFFKNALLSGWQTARIILMKPEKTHSGLLKMDYAGLTPIQVSLVGAMITLAPGTTTVEIDQQHQVFTLHLLDLDASKETLLAIEKDFIAPFKLYNGERL